MLVARRDFLAGVCALPFLPMGSAAEAFMADEDFTTEGVRFSSVATFYPARLFYGGKEMVEWSRQQDLTSWTA